MLRCIGAALVCLSCPVADALEVVDLTNTRVDIELDGRLDESLWTDLPAETDFTVVQPPSGDTPIYSTEARAFYTKDGLYAAVRAFQPPEHLIKRLSARDLRMRRDSVTVAIDTSGTGIYGYIFTISLGGAKRDGVILPERSYTWEWDGPWVGETASDEDGWTAELFLPWSMVTMPQAEKRNIGMYISRHVGYLDQVWSHPALPRTQPRFLSAFAPHDMSNVEPKPNYSIYPFTSLSHERTESDGEFRAGADAFWQISPQLKLTATLLPDFGQIEQDDVDINFTAFETFFPEKRPFFLEGQEIFETGITNLVFTRRIGEVPRPRGLPDGFSANELDLITNRDLLGAAKVTGQSGEFRYGLLTAFEDDTDVRASDGNETIIVQETGRNFAAIRGLWERANGPYRGIGFLATAVDTPDEIREVLEFDGAYRSADGNVALRGQLMGSSVAGENDAGFSGDFVFRPILGHTHTATLEPMSCPRSATLPSAER